MQTQSSSTTTLMAYPPRPGSQSPTLTEPDMILPLHNEMSYESGSSSQHTSFQFSSLSGDAWQRSTTGSASEYSNGALPRTPTTPIIYGNGTMLSDIGEVTEVESTPGKKLPGPAERRFLKQQQLQNGHRISSASLGHELRRSGTKTGTHERKISVESSSTITSEPQSAMFEDIDDAISVDDSNFQGDDEESVADSYTDPYRKELVEMETRRLSRREGNAGEDEDDQNSSAALSRRAEQILLNAKRRLNNMEGNLTRARSSLYATPSVSMPSIYSSSPLTNPSLLQIDRRISGIPSRQRSFSSFHPDSTASSPGHSRVWSENNISPSRATAFPVRASSAAASYRARSSMGSNAANPTSPLSPGTAKEESNGNARPTGSGQSSPRSRISPPQASHLAPLVEDGVPEFGDRTNGWADTDRDFSTLREGRLSRSSSTSSMRMQDIHTQMHDLKGRLSVLRDRARDDSMKRRSLQSLRTPSPFTTGEQWYSGGLNGQENAAKTGSVVDHGQSRGGQNGEPSKDMYTSQFAPMRQAPRYAESEAESIYEDVGESRVKSPELASPRQHYAPIVEEGDYDTCSEESESSSKDSYNDDHEEFDEFDNEDNSDASIYHESVSEQISHEDREDAFDYEHFFLHSAMGTMSRERRGSISSEDSVETTRGPTAPMPLVQNGHDPSERSSVVHLRSDSNASISTLATFATARSTMDDDENSEDEEDPFDLTVPHTDARNIDAPDSPTITPYKSTTTPPIAANRSTFGSLPRNTTINDYNDIGIARGSGLYDIDIRPLLHSRNISLDSATSTSTTRSFPLSTKPKELQNAFTPPGTASSTDSYPIRSTSLENNRKNRQPSPVYMLSKDDQVLVERLLASLGNCVLGLKEMEPGSYDSKIWRRRLDAARRVLEGEEGAI